MKIAAVFPGQGAQAVGMGVELAAARPAVARRFAEAADVLGWDLLAVCRDGPEERLADTLVAQPALYVTGYATWEALAGEGVAASFAAGHSVGEYTACAAAGAIPFAAGLRAVKARGESMAAAAAKTAGTMLAVIGAKEGDVDAWVAGAAARGPVVVANRNAPDQLIVSGAVPAVEAVEERSKAAGVRAIRLKVSGAFHSPLMQEAGDRMREVLRDVPVAEPEMPVVGNVTGLPLTTARQIREELESQLTSAVRWDACVRTLAGHGVGAAVECGPGRVLAGLIRKIERSVKTHGAGSAAEFAETLAALTGAARAAA